jgi:hypothetical protein
VAIRTAILDKTFASFFAEELGIDIEVKVFDERHFQGEAIAMFSTNSRRPDHRSYIKRTLGVPRSHTAAIRQPDKIQNSRERLLISF